MNTVAMLVTDAEKAAVTAAIADATPDDQVSFLRKVVPADPAPTWQTPQTHWYMSASGIADDVLLVWAALAPTLEGLIMFTAVNAENPSAWAVSNMASQGLMFQPDEPVIDS
jgi:hypothetical protein